MSAELLQILENFKRHHREVHSSLLALPVPGWSGDRKDFWGGIRTKHSHSSHCLVVWNGWDFEVWNCKLFPHLASKIWVSDVSFSFGGVLSFKALHFWSHSCHCPLYSRAHSPTQNYIWRILPYYLLHMNREERKPGKLDFPLSLVPCKPLIFLSRAERNYLLYFYVPACNKKFPVTESGLLRISTIMT